MAKHSRNKTHKGYAALFILIPLLIIAGIVLFIFNCTSCDNLETKLLKRVYPDDYRQYVEEYSKEYNVDKNLIFAIIKVESDFDPESESSTGARGLMQMIPDTYEYVRNLMGENRNSDPDELFDPETSIKYGTYYMSYLLERFDNNERNAIAAYNGGENNVEEWLKDDKLSRDGENIEEIPFPETREYVSRVEKAQSRYNELYG